MTHHQAQILAMSLFAAGVGTMILGLAIGNPFWAVGGVMGILAAAVLQSTI